VAEPSHARHPAHGERQAESRCRSAAYGRWQARPLRHLARISFKYERNVVADLKPGEIQPWAQKLAVERAEDLGKDHMSVQCLPFGASYNYSPRKAKIVQTRASCCSWTKI